jgi:fluoride ion exporter CrcB/FEX
MIARMTWALVGVAGALGAVARYGVGLAVGPREFPWATLSINVVGSFLIGIILTVGALDRLSDQATAALASVSLGPSPRTRRSHGKCSSWGAPIARCWP